MPFFFNPPPKSAQKRDNRGNREKTGKKREKSANFEFFSKTRKFTLKYIFGPVFGKIHANLAILKHF